MNRRDFIRSQIGVLALPSLLALTGCEQGLDFKPCELGHGVNLCGAEFGTQRQGFSNLSRGRIGQDYTYNSERTIHYFSEHSIRLIRFPIRWERIQPQLGQELDPEELDRIRTVLRWGSNQHAWIILDLHNYGRYVIEGAEGPRECVIDHTLAGGKPLVTREHLADLWQRLAEALHESPALVGYGLMNEPHDMGKGDWKVISQASVDAIRQLDQHKIIFVAGDSWSNSHRFREVNGPKAWIQDPAERVVYEAHCYLDRDYSGQYELTYDQELLHDPQLAERPTERLRPFAEWCLENKVCGFIGEYGVPVADARWVALLKTMTDYIAKNKLMSCYWSAGEWWADYPLSIQPRKNFSETAPALDIIADLAKSEPATFGRKLK